MSEDIIISVENVSKAYRIWDSPAARLLSPLQENLAGCLPGGSVPARYLRRQAAGRYKDFFALRDVSFAVSRGETVGVIGRNGSGKSTLLQIIARTLQPTDGRVRVQGQVAALLELGSGFNPEFTGRENVYLNAVLLGLSRREVDERFDRIAAFADIGDFIEQPVKTYSSGMLMRLAFAVQTAVDPKILIVDEALSVGDFFFQQKCFQLIRELRARGTTILFVSHDMASVRDLCSRALYLQRGHVVFCGDTQQAISSYFRESEGPAAKQPARVQTPAARGARSSELEQVRATALWQQELGPPVPGKPAQLLAVAVCDAQGQVATKHRLRDVVTFRSYFFTQLEAEIHVAIEFKNRHGQVVSSLGSRVQGMAPLRTTTGQLWCFEARLALGLEAGEYSFQICLGLPHPTPNLGIRVAESPWLGPITIQWDYAAEAAPFLGMFDLPAAITVREVP